MTYPPYTTGGDRCGPAFIARIAGSVKTLTPTHWNMNRLALALLIVAPASAADAGIIGKPGFFGESRFGNARVSTADTRKSQNAFSIGLGAQLTSVAAARIEHMTTAKTPDKDFGWSVTSAGMQFERDAYRNGLGFYGITDYNRISADSDIASQEGSYFGFGLGARYQIDGAVRGFVDGKLQSESFGYLSAGMRIIF